MQCCFCSQEIESGERAIELDWLPGFWHAGREYAGPICPDCGAKHLTTDEDGECHLKSDSLLPPAAIPLPQLPLGPAYRHKRQKFPLGQIVSTPAALQAIEDAGQTPDFFLDRHVQGNWGEVCGEDKQLNDQALVDGGRLLSAYRTLKNVRIWIITEADRSSTCCLLPQEY